MHSITAGRFAMNSMTELAELSRLLRETRSVRFSIPDFTNVASKRDPISINLDVGFTLNMQSKFRVDIYFQEEIHRHSDCDCETEPKTYMKIRITLIRSDVPTGTPVVVKFCPTILKANGKRIYSRNGFPQDATVAFKAPKNVDYTFQRFADIDFIRDKQGVLRNDTLMMEIETTIIETSSSSLEINTITSKQEKRKDSSFKELFKGIRGVSRNDKVGRDLAILRDTEDFSDCVLTVRGQIFKVHRCILAARSPVFSAMFKSTMLESNTGNVQIDDVEPDVMEALLAYIYSGKLPKLEIVKEHLENILYTTEKYNLSGLSYHLDKMISERVLTSKNMTELKDLAEMFGLPQTIHKIKTVNSEYK